MGSRTADKLKEIEEIRGSLQAKLNEIEQRVPLAGYGKKIAAGLAGSSVAGSALAIGLRRLRGGRKKKKRKGDAAPASAPTSITVTVFPKGAAWLAAAGLAAWAGMKVYESLRSKSADGAESFKPAVVPMPEPGRQAGSN